MNKELIDSLKNLADVVAVCLFGWLITKVVIYGIIKILEMWRDANKERNTLDQKRVEVDNRRNELDEKIAEIVSNNGKLMESVVGRLEKLAKTDGEIKEAVLEQHQDLAGKVTQHDSKVDALVSEFKIARDTQYKALQERLDAIQEKLDLVTECTKNIPSVAEKVAAITKVADEVASISKMIEELKLLITKEETDGNPG